MPARCDRTLIYFVEYRWADICSLFCSMQRHRKGGTCQLWRIRCPGWRARCSQDGKGLLRLSIGARTTIRKILYFFGGGNGCAGQFLWVKPTLGVDFGNVVAGTTHANVPLHHQSWERVTCMLHNIDLGANFRLMRWDQKSAIWGGGRGSVSFVLSAFLIVAYVELLWVFMILSWEILECSPQLWYWKDMRNTIRSITLLTLTHSLTMQHGLFAQHTTQY